MTPLPRIFPLALAAAAVLTATSAFGLTGKVRTEGDVRIFEFRESELNSPWPEDAPLIQLRKHLMGLNLSSWAAPTVRGKLPESGKIAFTETCPKVGEYVPRNENPWPYPSFEYAQHMARASMYELLAYRKALETRDCSCAALEADWEKAINLADEVLSLTENPEAASSNIIDISYRAQDDYDRMCNVHRPLLEGGSEEQKFLDLGN